MATEQHVLTETRPATRRLVLALALTGLSMRTAVTSVGAVLDDIQHGLHANGVVQGLITTLPVLCFAGLGAITPRLARRAGPTHLLVLALIASVAGTVLRALAPDSALFVVLSLLSLTGGAVSNVLLPSLVKRYFPDRIGAMTALYTTALAVGTTVAAGLTVPLGDLAGPADRWRLGLGVWTVLPAVALLPWLATLRQERREPAAATRAALPRLTHSRTAWALTVFFGFQSFQAYICFGWLAKFLHAHGISSDLAGWMVALFSGLSIPVSMVVPRVRSERLPAAVILLSLCSLAAYAGLAVAPVGGAWAWMVLAGLGSGTFPIALTMIGLRSRHPDSTAALSSFVQAIGYVVAGLGPLLFGVLNDATGHWGASLSLLFVALVISAGAGLLAGRPRFVDDELAASAA